MLQILIAGFLLGTISSFHCVGMCGPLALALPVQNLSSSNKTLALLLYHCGRIAIYASLGLVFGLMGRGLYLAGFQQWFSIGLGLFMLIFLAQYFGMRILSRAPILYKFNQRIQKLMITLWKSPSKKSFVLMGMANGLLPCGMVYLAVAGALNVSQVRSGVMFMTMFGLGTLPPLFALSFFGSLIRLSMRNKIKQITPFVIAIMAIILILRGLNLGIPFISPLLQADRAPAIICH
jgi:uncharacterized protein